MTNLLTMNERMNQWMSEKPGFSEIELKLYDNDVMLGHFVSTGTDGDAFIKVYKSHVFPQTSQRGGRWNAYRYCTRANDNTDCVFCNQGHGDIKERMSMWFYVYSILHAAPVQRKPNLPQGQHNGRIYYVEEVNGFKRWDDSAWSQSPWSAILQLYGMYGQNLHPFVVSLNCTGQSMQKRYSVFALPNSAGLPPEIYQRALQECTPIPQTLLAQQQQPVQMNPTANVQALPNAAPVPAFSVPGTPAPAPMPSVWGAPPPATAAAYTPVAAVPMNAPQPAVAPVPDIGIPGAAPAAPVPMPTPPAPAAVAPPIIPVMGQQPPPAAPVAAAPVAPPPPPPAPAPAPAEPPAPAPEQPRRMF